MDLSRIFGVRDRLRCVHCGAIGTFKPHGGWIDEYLGDDAGVRRWMCKWCGYTRYSHSYYMAIPSKTRGCWLLEGDPDLQADDSTPRLKCHPTNPWRG